MARLEKSGQKGRQTDARSTWSRWALVGCLAVATGSLTFRLSAGLEGKSATAKPPQADILFKSIRFDSSLKDSETKVPLKEIQQDFPTDWSGYEALVMELKASSSQRFDLRIYTTEGTETVTKYSRVRLHLYPKVWIRAAIPVSMLAEPPRTGVDMAAVGNRSRLGYYIGLWGPFVPLTSVRAIGFHMESPVNSPLLEVRSISLAKTSPGDAVLDGTPLVDEFGQYVHEAWPGKADTPEQLQKAWREEDAALAKGEFGYCSYGGYSETEARATGFFRVEKIDGRWWFVDPDGHLFLSVGSDVMRPESSTRTVGREHLFKALPPDDLRSGMARDGDRGASFFTWNLVRRFGPDWAGKWLAFTIRRMDAWGLNTVANWSDPRLWDVGKKPYAVPLASWQTEVSYLGLPDVYSQEFERLAQERAKRQCESRRTDPWLLGYFLANEPPFPQKQLQTAGLILSGPDTATKAELKKWLEAGDTNDRRKEFIDRAFDRYIQVASAAVRKYDPNHLNLGMRSGGRPTDAEITAARAFDVYSVNIYSERVPPEQVKRIAELTGKPIVIGEFHFGTPGRGLAASLVQVKDAKERGVAYRYYVEQAFAMPELIGTHWFQWVDQPSTGRFDGENYHIGLVDVTDRPYPEMIEALKQTHQRLEKVHAGAAAPFATKAAAH